MNSLQQQIRDRHTASNNYLETKRLIWDEMENIFFGKLGDAISKNARSRVFDHKISTMILESEARVMAQIGVGKVKCANQTAGALMNVILDRYIIPHANAQFPLLVKHRMMHRKSKIYGNSFALVDWDVKRNGYVGPDLWLLAIRDVFPQVGAVSLDDSDHIIIRTYRPISFFESLKPQAGFKNIAKIVTQLKKTSGSKDVRDDEHKTTREQNEYPDQQASKGSGYHEVLMQFERDRWIYAVPEVDYEILKDSKNPNEDGELPVVNKYGIPLDDDFMAMGDAERGKTMQYAINSSWNLALDSAKMSLFPPVVVNQDAVVKSTIKRQPGANWLVRGNINNVAKALELSPRGVETHQAIYNLANAALLNQFGTTDTTVSKDIDSSFGKTPEALKQQAARENSRDAWDKFYVDLYITQVNKKFVNMMSNKQSSAIEIEMFNDDIDKLARQYPEVNEMFDEKTGKLKINKGKTGRMQYDYEYVSGSSFAVDQQQQLENLQGLLTLFSNPQTGQYLEQRMQTEGTTLNMSKLVTGIVSKNLENWDEIIVTQDMNTPGAQEDDEVMAQSENAFMQMLEQVQNGGDISQIPPQQPGMPEGGMPMDQGNEEQVVQQNMAAMQQMVGQMQQEGQQG